MCLTCSDDIESAKELWRVLLLLDAVPNRLLSTSLGALPQRYRASIIVFEIVHFRPQYIHVEVWSLIALLLTVQSVRRRLLRFGAPTRPLDPSNLVRDYSAIFRPYTVEKLDAGLLLVQDDWTAVALHKLEFSQRHFVVLGNGYQVGERVIKAARVQRQALVVH